MMFLLRTRFAYFYADYGCYLWTAVTLQALSLLIETTINAMISQNDAVDNFLDSNGNPVFVITLNVIYHIVTFIVPSLTQLSCLIFVWIRNKRESQKLKTP